MEDSNIIWINRIKSKLPPPDATVDIWILHNMEFSLKLLDGTPSTVGDMKKLSLHYIYLHFVCRYQKMHFVFISTTVDSYYPRTGKHCLWAAILPRTVSPQNMEMALCLQYLDGKWSSGIKTELRARTKYKIEMSQGMIPRNVDQAENLQV